MDIERNIGRIAAAIALLFCGVGARAAAPGLLLIPAKPDPNLVLLPAQAGQSSERPPEDPTERFRLAIAEALQSDERAVGEACKSLPPADPKSSANFAWQARCLYRRR